MSNFVNDRLLDWAYGIVETGTPEQKAMASRLVKAGDLEGLFWMSQHMPVDPVEVYNKAIDGFGDWPNVKLPDMNSFKPRKIEVK